MLFLTAASAERAYANLIRSYAQEALTDVDLWRSDWEQGDQLQLGLVFMALLAHAREQDLSDEEVLELWDAVFLDSDDESGDDDDALQQHHQ